MSGREIEVAQAQRAGLPPPPVRPGSLRDIASELEPLPLWRQAMIVPGLGGLFAGSIWFKAAISLLDYGLAAAVTAGGMLLIGLGSIGNKRPPEKPPA